MIHLSLILTFPKRHFFVYNIFIQFIRFFVTKFNTQFNTIDEEALFMIFTLHFNHLATLNYLSCYIFWDLTSHRCGGNHFNACCKNLYHALCGESYDYMGYTRICKVCYTESTYPTPVSIPIPEKDWNTYVILPYFNYFL